MSPPLAADSQVISVLIADSNRMQAQLLTNALRRRSEFHISNCAIDIASILHAVGRAPTKVVVISLNHSIDVAAQMAALRRVHLSYPAIAKILLVESYDRELVVSAFRSGARGIFCISDTHFRLLCRCIQRIADGQIWANTEQLNFLLALVSEVPSLRVLNSRGEQILTPREEQVVALVAEGMSNRDIAGELDLSEHTVKKYLFRIFDKLGVSSRVELVLYAVKNGDPLPAEWLAGVGRSRPSKDSTPAATSQFGKPSIPPV
jgi:DNA-binding NarL/FixJ family response regulator